MAKPDLIRLNKTTAFDNSGLVQPGTKLFTYTPGTLTKQNTYPTSIDAVNNTNVNPNPMISDSSGRFSDMWITSSYKQVLSPGTDSDPPTNSYWTIDNIPLLSQTLSTSYKNNTYTMTASDRDKVFKADASSVGLSLVLLSASLAGDGFRVAIKKIDSSSNLVTISPNGSDFIDGSNTSFVLSGQNDYIELTCDGTQWFKSTHNTYTQNINIIGSTTSIITDGVTLTKRVVTETLSTFTSLSSAGKSLLVPSSGIQQFKIRDITIGRSLGLSGGGGDRLLAITDGTNIWSIITTTLVQNPVLTRWGTTNIPGPVSAYVEVSPTQPGASLYAQYSGGTTDYTTGNIELIVTVDKVA